MGGLWFFLFVAGPLGAAPIVHFPVRFEPAGSDGVIARCEAWTFRIAHSGELQLSVDLKMVLHGGAPATPSFPSESLPGRTHDLRGDDPQRWRTGIPQYASVRFRNVWRGVDLIYHGDGSRLEYDFVLAPGASPDLIVLQFRGAHRVHLESGGGLAIRAENSEFRFRAPRILQDGRPIHGGYRVMADDRVGFQVGRYDRTRPVLIDPVLGYAALFGGHGGDPVGAMALDSAGNLYIAGTTLSEIPLVNPINAQQGTGNCSVEPGKTFQQCEDAYVAKFDPTGTTLLYSTYLGGNDRDFASGIAVGRDGSVYVSGRTLPAGSALDNTTGQAWVMKLNATGSAIVYNRNIGNATASKGVAVDVQGNAFVAGVSYSLSFPAVNAIESRPPITSLLVTHDAGNTWNSLNQNLPALAVNSLAIDPTKPATLYAATSSGLYQSLDSGVNWKPLLAAAASASQVLLDPKTPTTVYALYVGSTGGYQIAKSIDSGSAWQVLTGNLPPPKLPAPVRQFGGLAIDPSNPATLWLTDVAQGSPEIYESTDGGAHWVDSHDFPVFFSPAQGDSISGGQILVDPIISARVYACCAFSLIPTVPAVFRTDDGGKTWVEGGQANLSTIAVDPHNGASLYSASQSSLLHSVDEGQTWTPIPLPAVTPPGAAFHGPVIDSTGALYLTNDAGLLLRSTDGGDTWTEKTGPWTNAATAPVTQILALDPVSPSSTIYVSSPGTGGATTFINHAFAAKLDGSGAILWATLIAGSQQDQALAVATDAAGNAYVAGTTNSLNFPVVNALQAVRGKAAGNGFDAFLTKISSDGSKLAYSTYLGGSGDDSANALALDAAGNVYLAGSTNESDFPTVNAIQAKPGSQSGASFVAELDPSGQKLLFSTYLSGSGEFPFNDGAAALAADGQGNVWVAGRTGVVDFPLAQPVQASPGSMYVSELVPASKGFSLGFSTYLGGSSTDYIAALAISPKGGTWIGGTSFSPDFIGNANNVVMGGGFLARIDLSPPAPTPGVPLVTAAYNAASFRLGDVVTPGEAVSIFGAELAPLAAGASGYPLPQALQGVSVTVGGLTAPLYYVSPGQINFQVPFEIATGASSIVVKRGTQSGAARAVQVIPFSPGIFTVVHVSDYTIVTPQNPAHAGENLAIFCTGLGVPETGIPSGGAAPPVPDPVQPLVEAVEDSRLAQVQYAGLAPGFAGLYQVNFQVISNETPGTKLLYVGIQGLYSNPFLLVVQ